jgi:hypothetical protein
VKQWVFLVLGFSAVELTPGADLQPDVNPRYFPLGAFANGKSDGDFKARWYAEQLRALNEPSLSANSSVPAGESVYRFTWLRTFDHPITVRVVVHPDGTGTLTAVMATGAGGCSPGNRVTIRPRNIGHADVRRLLRLISGMDFWDMRTELSLNPSTVQLDGAQWIFEALTADRYHVIDRWSPDSGPVRELGLYMVRELGRFHIGRNSVY